MESEPAPQESSHVVIPAHNVRVGGGRGAAESNVHGEVVARRLVPAESGCRHFLNTID